MYLRIWTYQIEKNIDIMYGNTTFQFIKLNIIDSNLVYADHSFA